MKKISILILITSFFIFCNTNNQRTKEPKNIEDTGGQKTIIKPINYIYKQKSIDNSYWMPIDYIINLNSKGIEDPSIRNSKNYPFEFIHIKNWKQKSIYANSTKFDYRKLRFEIINDSTYYLTKFNRHHYNNDDSIFFAKRNNQLSVITSNDSISYCSNLGDFLFDDLFLSRLQRDIFFFKKNYNVSNLENNLLESEISFDLTEETILGSKIFKTFKNTGYAISAKLNGNEVMKYLIKLNNEDWYFYLKNNDIILEKDGLLKYKLSLNN